MILFNSRKRVTEGFYDTSKIVLITAINDEVEKKFLCHLKKKNGNYVDFFSGKELKHVGKLRKTQLYKKLGRTKLTPEQLYNYLSSVNGDILV